MTRPTEDAPDVLPRWKVVLFLAVILGSVLAALEGGTRVYLRLSAGYDGKHLYQFTFDSYKNIHPTPNYVDTRGVRHNAAGFRRSTDISRTKADGVFRVFLMGGSTAYGLGGLWSHIDRGYPVLKNTETIDAYLQRDLAKLVPGVQFEVVNAAITSTWTHHHLIYLNQTVLGYHPDMVLFMDGFNDFYFYNRGHDQFRDYSYDAPAEVIMGEPSFYSLFYGNAWWLFRRSALAHALGRGARNLKLALQGPGRRDPINPDSAMAGMREVFPRSALSMHRRSGLILASEGVTPVFMLQPMLILERDKPKDSVEAQLFTFNAQSYLAGYEPFIHRAVAFAGTEEAAMAAEVGGEFIDLTGLFKQTKERTYTDYAHLTPRGNEILAAYVAGRLAPLIVRRTSQHLSGMPPGQ